MPRAIWSGTISFGLVSVPVRMFAAVSEHKLHFNLLHRKDESPIGYAKVCKLEEKPVPEDEIVKAYEIEKGEFVYLEDEDFQAARAEGGHAFDIEQFVPIDDIDPIAFERTYYLGPAEGADKVYRLLHRAMADAGLAAVATYVFHERERLGCLRVRDDLLVLERMYFADELRPASPIAPKAGGRVTKEELALAADLIDRLTGDFDHQKYRDRHRDRLKRIIAKKRDGKETHAAPRQEPAAPADLMAALQASLDAAAKGKRRTRSRKRAA